MRRIATHLCNHVKYINTKCRPQKIGNAIIIQCRPTQYTRKTNKVKVSEGAKIKNRYNQVPHLTQDTNGKVTNSQLDTTNESQEVSPFPAGDHKAHLNRRAQIHSKHKTEQTNKRSIKEIPPCSLFLIKMISKLEKDST